MKRKTIVKADLIDGLSLMDFINEHIGKNAEISSCCIEDDDGRTFENVALVEDTLSDGSTVHNLVLS